jgi:predicted permease
MHSVSTDLKQILRRLWRTPGFTAITLLTLAIGIGANSAIFSVVNGVLLRPLPFPNPDRLVGVWETAPGIGWKKAEASASTYFTFRDFNRTFEAIGLYSADTFTMTGVARPEQVDGLQVTQDTLPLLGVRPVLGRLFTRADDSPGSPETILLAYGYWQQKFCGSPAVIGRRIIADGKARTIIGVLAPDFHFHDSKAVVVFPLQFNRNEVVIGNFSYHAVARLRPGVTIAQANADVARMLPLMFRNFKLIPGISLEMFHQARFGPDVHPLKDDVVGDVGNILWVVMGVVAIVLFTACANVANLLLVRTDTRRQELAVRMALGASKGRLARELLLESLVLGLLGGALGLAAASYVLRLLIALGPANLPRLQEISIDLPVLLFTLGVSLFGGLLFGIAPVLKYAVPRIGASLREGGRALTEGRERHRARNLLVVVQIALALVLLISSGLMIRTFQAMRRVQPGFNEPASIQTFHVFIPKAQVEDPERVARMFEQMDRKLAALPGVKSVGITTSITMDGNNDHDPVLVEDHPETQSNAPVLRQYKMIGPGYFASMGNPLIAGRDLTWDDIYQRRPVVLVSENLARLYWPSPSAALGKRIRESLNNPWREIIGVAGNERDNGAEKPAPYLVYWPFLMNNFWTDKTIVLRDMAFAIRTNRTGSEGFLTEARHVVWSVDAEVPVAQVQTMAQIYDSSMARTSFTLVMLALAAGMALLLGVIGIYGVISYAVSQRTREIGIRMALGASQRSVERMFVGQAFVLVFIGVAAGIAVAAALTRAMRAVLFETSPLDPLTYCAVSVVIAAAAFLASYLPARRATAIDPADALRIQ